jgi:hypothetical protein
VRDVVSTLMPSSSRARDTRALGPRSMRASRRLVAVRARASDVRASRDDDVDAGGQVRRSGA